MRKINIKKGNRDKVAIGFSLGIFGKVFIKCSVAVVVWLESQSCWIEVLPEKLNHSKVQSTE